jgi:hypothetical protein
MYNKYSRLMEIHRQHLGAGGAASPGLTSATSLGQAGERDLAGAGGRDHAGTDGWAGTTSPGRRRRGLIGAGGRDLAWEGRRAG